jgi:hypothetical protein
MRGEHQATVRDGDDEHRETCQDNPTVGVSSDGRQREADFGTTTGASTREHRTAVGLRDVGDDRQTEA